MTIRELREIFFKSCTPPPVFAAIINYLAQMDIRFAILDSKVDSIDIDTIQSDVDNLNSDIEDLENEFIEFKKQMQGAIIRFSGATATTSNSSPYHTLLNMSSADVFDRDIEINWQSNPPILRFKKGGIVEVDFKALFSASSANQLVTIGNAATMDNALSNRIAWSGGTYRVPSLHHVYQVNAYDELYFFIGTTSGTVRTAYPNDLMTQAQIKYLYKE